MKRFLSTKLAALFLVLMACATAFAEGPGEGGGFTAPAEDPDFFTSLIVDALSFFMSAF